MSEPDRVDLSGIEPLDDPDDAFRVDTSLNNSTEAMDKLECDSSKATHNSDTTLTSGYISRSFPSLAALSKSLSLSPDFEQRASFSKYTAVHRSAGSDKENADKYRRPFGIGPRVQLFTEGGEMRRTRSSDIAGVGHVVKKPQKGITRSQSSPPPGAADNASVCYFSRDKFFQLTPEVDPLITNDLNNNDNNGMTKPTSSNPSGPKEHSEDIDVSNKVAEEKTDEADAAKNVPPLSIEQLVNISSVSDADIEDADDDASLDQSAESLNFQQDSDQNGRNGENECPEDDRVPRSFYKDDDSLMGEIVLDQAFKLSLAPSPSLSEDEENPQLCQMPPMDLQPVVYNDLEKTFTGSPSASGSVNKPHEKEITSSPKQELTPDNKQEQDIELVQNQTQKQFPDDLSQRLPLHEVVGKLPVEKMSYNHSKELLDGVDNSQEEQQHQQNDSRKENWKLGNKQLEKEDKEKLSSMTASQSSNGFYSEYTGSMHGAGMDPLATHDLSISSSIYSYLGKASKPQEVARQAADMKTSSPMVNRAHVQEFLQKSGNEVDSIGPLRDHVRNVLRLTENVMPDKSPYDHSEDDLLLGGYQDNADLSILSDLNIPRSRNVSYIPSYLDNLSGVRSGYLFDHQNHSSAASNSSNVFAENQTLKETLEKERFRRKHVEKQIGNCQSQILELQEQLAVAVSMGRKKDGMIEQLDKALAKVANGWKKKDAETKEFVKQLQHENETLHTRGQHQQEMAAKLERELSSMVEKLKEEQQRAAQVEEETERVIKEQRELKNQNIEKLKQAEERLRTVTDERDVLNASKDRLQGQLLDLRQALDSERESWEDKEKEYLQKIDEITTNHLRSVDQEKRKTAMAIQTLEDTEGVLGTVQNEMSRLSMQLDAANREKESLKVEMGIHEARYESGRRKLEADLRGDYERQMSQKLSEAHKRQAKSEEEMRERHRRQVVELNARHAQEIEGLNKEFQEEVQDKEDAIRQLGLESEEKMLTVSEEIDTLQSEVKKLEGERQEMTNRLQEMMQAHCSEALRLLQIGSKASQFSQEAIFTTSLPHQSSKLGMQTSVTMATTETSWSTPTMVSSTAAQDSAHLGFQEGSLWNNSLLSTQSPGISLREDYSDPDAKQEGYSHPQLQSVYNAQFESASQAPPTSWQTSQAPPNSWQTSPDPPSSWQTSQAQPTSRMSTKAPSSSTSQALSTSWQTSQAPISWPKAPPTSQQSLQTPQETPFSSYTSSFLTQQSNLSGWEGLHEFEGLTSTINNSTCNQFPQASTARQNESKAPSTSGYSSAFEFGSHLAAKYGQPLAFQIPPTLDQAAPIMFHSSIGSTSDKVSIMGREKSYECQVPPTTHQSTESFKQSSASQELQLSYKEDLFKSSIHDHTPSQSASTHQELPPPMYTSSPPRGRGYGTSKPLPHSSSSSQGSNFLRQLVESVEEDEFQVLREDTTIESNTEETESHASPRKVEDTSMEKEMPLQGDISGISDRFHEHQNRQAELQHYIRMLLQRSPGSANPSVTSALRSFQDDEPTRDISNESYSPIRIPQPDPVIVSGQGQDEVKRSAFEKKLVTAQDLPPVSGLSPKQVSEIAKLIGQYRPKSPGGQQQAQALSAVQSVNLRNLHQSEESTSSSERSPPRTVVPKKFNPNSKEPLTRDKVKKNLGISFGEAAKEQLLKQEAVARPSSAKQHQGSAGVRGPVKKVSKSKISEEKKVVHKDKKAGKVWK